MVRVELQTKTGRALPCEVAADRFVRGAIGRQRAAVRQVLADVAVIWWRGRRRGAPRIGRTEIFRIEDRSGDRTIGPFARDVAEIEPHADVAVAGFDLVL